MSERVNEYLNECLGEFKLVNQWTKQMKEYMNDSNTIRVFVDIEKWT